MIQVLTIFSIVISVFEILLGIYFWFTHTDQKVRKFLSVFMILLGAWVAWNSYSSLLGDKLTTAHILLGYFLASSLLVTLNIFLIFYPVDLFKLGKQRIIIGYAFFCGLPFVLLLQELLDTRNTLSVISAGPVYQKIVQPSYSIYFIPFFAVLLTSSIIVLIKQIIRYTGYYRRNLLILLSGVVLGGVPSIFLLFRVTALGEYTIVNPLLAVFSSMIFFLGVLYIILEK